jgi:hypothetical protein
MPHISQLDYVLGLHLLISRTLFHCKKMIEELDVFWCVFIPLGSVESSCLSYYKVGCYLSW